MKKLVVLVVAGFLSSYVGSTRTTRVITMLKAVHARHPGLKVMGYVESGGTDGMHFLKALATD